MDLREATEKQELILEQIERVIDDWENGEISTNMAFAEVEKFIKEFS